MCKRHELSPGIPFDLVIEILMRLPAKSLMRFKSVSKLWSSLICSRCFTNRFLRVSSPAPRLYVGLSFLDKSQFKDIFLSASPTYDSGSTIASFEANCQDLTNRAMRGYVSDVFRGLMCFVSEPRAQIYNTTTRQLVLLPEIEESSIIAEDHELKKIMYHIGHDPVHDLYKVVCTAAKSDLVGGFITYTSEQWVLLLGGDRSSRWRKIPCQSSHLPLTQGLTMNGHMYYLAWVSFDNCVVVSLDMISEEISLSQAPKDNFCPISITLIECGEKLAIFHYADLIIEGMMKLWVMEDAEKNKWSCKTLVLHSSQIHVVHKISLRVEGTTRNGEVIFVPQRSHLLESQNTAFFYILLYDLQKNHMRKVEIKETPNRHLTKLCDVAGFDDVENLMSL